MLYLLAEWLNFEGLSNLVRFDLTIRYFINGGTEFKQSREGFWRIEIIIHFLKRRSDTVLHFF